jgi:PadR family transcriptional regulator PadR
METEKSLSQMRKGVLEFCILTLLSNREAYASDLIDSLKASRLIIVEGTLYPLLTRLKNDGLLTYRWEESRSGPPRKYYQITPMGQAYRKDLEKTWNELVGSVENIINIQ